MLRTDSQTELNYLILKTIYIYIYVNNKTFLDFKAGIEAKINERNEKEKNDIIKT